MAPDTSTPAAETLQYLKQPHGELAWLINAHAANQPDRIALDDGEERLTWAEIVAVGPNVRTIESGDQVLFNPEDRYEVEVNGTDYIVLRERDIHAVAAERLDEGSTGLYL